MEKSVRKDYFLLMVLCLILSALCFSGKALPPPLSVIYGVMLFLIGIGTLWMLVKERLRRRKGKGRLSRIFLGLFELLIVGLACLAVAVFLLSINPPGIVIVGALSLLVFFALFTFLGIMNIVGEREVKPEKTEQQGDSGRW